MRTENQVEVVIEAPKGGRSKFRYVEELRMFKLGSVLPKGSTFPFDLGFVPHTRTYNGELLEILVLTDSQTFTGSALTCRLIGCLGEDDRLIAVSDRDKTRSLKDLSPEIKDKITHFLGSEAEQYPWQGPEKAYEVLARAKIAAETWASEYTVA